MGTFFPFITHILGVKCLFKHTSLRKHEITSNNSLCFFDIFRFHRQITCVCYIISSISDYKILASEFIKCDLKQNDFQECLTTAVQKAIRELNRPFRKVNLLGMEPLEIPELTIAAGSRIVFTQQIFKHLKLSGFNETTCSKVE